MNLKIKVITSTTREGRIGIHIAKWVTDFAKTRDHFDVELLDIAEINLPLMDEPNHPRFQNYTHEHTKAWSEKIEDGDAYIIVLGEYNYGFPAPIKNALDYLFNEWKYKPVSFVSYGGISAGLRSTQMLKQVVTTLSMMPVPEQVNIPFPNNFIDEHKVFHPDEHIIRSAENMLNQLTKWAEALIHIRK